MAKRRKKRRPAKVRNLIALAHSLRGPCGSGSHTDTRKEQRRKACRGRHSAEP